jgi:hypothetical protein
MSKLFKYLRQDKLLHLGLADKGALAQLFGSSCYPAFRSSIEKIDTASPFPRSKKKPQDIDMIF